MIKKLEIRALEENFAKTSLISRRVPEIRPDNEVRALLVQCAHAITRLKYKSDWVCSILMRKPRKVAVRAIANKLARQLWAMASKGDKFEKRFVLAAV